MLRVCTLLVLILAAPGLAQFTEEELKDPFNRKKAEAMRNAPPQPKPDPAAEAKAVQQMREQLGARLAEMNFSGAKLYDVITRLRDRRLNLFVNWRLLEVYKITRDTPVTIDLSGMRTCDALDALLDHLGGQTVDLTWYVESGYVVSIGQQSKSEKITRQYELPAGVEMATMIRRLEGIDPLSWQDAGGTVGLIVQNGEKLVITHDSRMHELVALELAAAAKKP